MTQGESDAEMIRRLSRSPYLLAVADSLIANMDRETLSALLASYLHLKSRGRATPRNLLRYAASGRFRKLAAVVAGAAPLVIRGMVMDGEFRSAVLSSFGPRRRRQGRHPRQA